MKKIVILGSSKLQEKEKYNSLDYYNKNAKQYCEQTLVGNLQENYDKFLKEIPRIKNGIQLLICIVIEFIWDILVNGFEYFKYKVLKNE